MKAIDLHVHLPTEQWLQQSIGPHLEATEAYFRAHVPRKTMDEIAEDYSSRDLLGVGRGWATTGSPGCRSSTRVC